MKKIMAGIICLCILTVNAGAAYDPEMAALAMATDTEDVAESVFEEVSPESGDLEVSAPSAILLEKTTGAVIYEKNADELKLPASVTKIMSVLLAVEAIDRGELSMDDTVSVSKTAADMGGSQVYLEEGEIMSVGDLLKCMVVASANDASVAMAEKIAGTEEAFATKMNQRAKELGMTRSHFTNCSGLWEDETHVVTARDVAIMSRELLSHDWIRKYTTIWTDSIRNGEFGLTNTNKLIRYFDGATGLKTGYTDKAGYCLSGSAERDGVEYIAVVLGCDSSESRFESVKKMLCYGFANYTVYTSSAEGDFPEIPVHMGREDTLQPPKTEGKTILIPKNKLSAMFCKTEFAKTLSAPVCEDTVVGKMQITDGEKVLAEIPILAGCAVERVTFWDLWKEGIHWLFAGCRE